MGAVCGCRRRTAISSEHNSSPQVSRPMSVSNESAPTVGCEVPAVAHEHMPPLEVVVDSTHSSSWDNNKRVEEARRARVQWLKSLRRNCATEEEFETTRTQPIWTQLNTTSCSSSCPPTDLSPAALQRIREENELHFDHLWRTEPTHKPSRAFLGQDFPRPGALWRSALNRGNDFSRPGAPSRLRNSLQKLLKSGSSQFYGKFSRPLEAGRKIGGGAQADIYEVIYDGKVLDWCVLKVFRSDCLLVDLQRTWSKNIARLFMGFEHFGEKQRNCCGIKHGVLLKSGRFAFMLQRCWGDLRKAIDLQIVNDRSCKNPPFSNWSTINIMLGIAQGMANLHENNILHRDLKAANCLLLNDPEKQLPWRDTCLVADFECSEGVMGTGFWRAPEVLLVLKNKERDINAVQEVWSEKTDVYSYAMTCYEVLTGCIPFEDRAANNYDGVIGGERPPMPNYVDRQFQELVRRCWHSEPSMRPSFNSILNEISIMYPNILY